MFNAVGGSTIHWGSHIPRFHPSDFRLQDRGRRSRRLAACPTHELEPYYDQNDRMIGISGLKRRPCISSQARAARVHLCPVRPGGQTAGPRGSTS